MADAEHDEGFLSRWSRRKAQARSAAAAPEPVVPEAAPPEAAAPRPVENSEDLGAPAATASESERVAPAASSSVGQVEAAASDPGPTLDDVAQLTWQSDFSRFVAAGVKTDVKNAALRKLFSNPHFNVMDGLDIYIADYNTPAPVPSGVLLRMAQAKYLGLIKERAEQAIAGAPGPMNHGTIEAEQVSGGPAAPPDVAPRDEIASNENVDLQLQPHDAAGPAGAEPGPGEDVGRER